MKRNSGDWITVNGVGGVSLALDQSNKPYVVTISGDVYRQRGLKYSFCPGKKTFPYQ